MSDVEKDFEAQAEDALDADETESVDEDADIVDLADDEIIDLEDDEIIDLEDDDDPDDETRSEVKEVVEVLSQKEQNARSLAIRRALELRADERRLHDDLDYLDD